VPLPRPAFTPGSRRVIAGLAVTAVATGGALLAIGLQTPAAEAVWAEAVPVAVARPATANSSSSSGTAEPAKSYVGGVRLASYDASAGTALLATVDTNGGATAQVRSGDVIASPPSSAAPLGALFKVGKVTPTDAGVKVSTGPATLSDALGAAEVDRTFQAKDIAMSVTPLATGVRPAPKVPTLPGAATGAGTTAPSPTRSTTKSTSPSAKTPAPSTPSARTTAPSKPSAKSTAPSTPSANTTPPSTPSAKTTAPSTPSAKTTAPNTPASATSNPAAPAGKSAEPTAAAATEATIPGLAIGGAEILDPTRTADGGLLLSLDIPLAGVAGITGTSKGGPKLSGWVGLTPKLIFSYGQKNVDGAKPFQAEIGVGGKYTYGWQVHAALAGLADTGETALRLPFAEVHLNQTFWIGPVPVVLSVDLTYFYRLTAQGGLSIDTEQTTAGEFAVGAAYDSRTGWAPLNRNAATTQGDAVPTLTGRGDLRATIGADLAVFLYDAAGVTGRLAPYVRAAVDATLEQVRWGVYAGFDLTATLTLQLKIFGITILRADLPIPPVHAEWKVAASDPEPAVPIAG